MGTLLNAVRGMNDCLPQEVARWQTVEAKLIRVMTQYGYQEIRFPLVEKTELFKRSVGEATDIVEKEMFVFNDVENTSLALRPEGTAPCVRAIVEHHLLRGSAPKLWYIGPMFRYERPQKGRYRQFHQLGVEAYGVASPESEVELLLMSQQFWRALDVVDSMELQINSLGSKEARVRYREALVDYFTAHKSELDEDSQRRLTTNPLRILDSKNEDMQPLLDAAPRILDYLDDESKAQFTRVCDLLTEFQVPYTVNSRLVRGLDYYTGTVFEWVTTQLGSQGTVLAGGRYNHLVAELGGPDTPAVGFAMGLERLLMLLDDTLGQEKLNPDIIIIQTGGDAAMMALQLGEKIRALHPNLKIVVNCDGGSMKSQFKRADKSGAKLALILGDDEVANNIVSVKNLRLETAQLQLDVDALMQYILATIQE